MGGGGVSPDTFREGLHNGGGEGGGGGGGSVLILGYLLSCDTPPPCPSAASFRCPACPSIVTAAFFGLGWQ